MSEKSRQNLMLAMIAIIPATVSGVLSNCQARMDASSKARSAEKRADKNSEAVLGGVTPAVDGLQEDLSKTQDWSKEVISELKELHDKIGDLEHEVAYLKGYVAYDSKGRYRAPTPKMDKTKPEVPEPLMKKPSVKIPDNIKDAREQLQSGAVR